MPLRVGSMRGLWRHLWRRLEVLQSIFQFPLAIARLLRYWILSYSAHGRHLGMSSSGRTADSGSVNGSSTLNVVNVCKVDSTNCKVDSPNQPKRRGWKVYNGYQLDLLYKRQPRSASWLNKEALSEKLEELFFNSGLESALVALGVFGTNSAVRRIEDKIVEWDASWETNTIGPKHIAIVRGAMLYNNCEEARRYFESVGMLREYRQYQKHAILR